MTPRKRTSTTEATTNVETTNNPTETQTNKENHMNNRFFSLHTSTNEDITDALIAKVSEYWETCKAAEYDFSVVEANVAKMLDEAKLCKVRITIHDDEKHVQIGRDNGYAAKGAVGAANRLIRFGLYNGSFEYMGKTYESRPGLHLFNNQHSDEFEAHHVGVMAIQQEKGALVPCLPVKLNPWERNVGWCAVNRRNKTYYASRLGERDITQGTVNDYVDLLMTSNVEVWIAANRLWFAPALITWIEQDDVLAKQIFDDKTSTAKAKNERKAETREAVTNSKHRIMTEEEALGEPKAEPKEVAPIMLRVIGSMGKIDVRSKVGETLDVYTGPRTTNHYRPVPVTEENLAWWAESAKLGYFVREMDS